MERLHATRRFLSRPTPWVVIAYVVLFVVGILGVVVYTRQINDRAARATRLQTRYEQCIASRPLARKVNRFIRGVETVGGVIFLNSVQMHAVTPPGSAAYRQQEINLDRLRRALHDQHAVKALPVPTHASCRSEVGLPSLPLVRGG